MAVGSWLYGQASKGFRNEPARKAKDLLRPVKHALVGKQGIYKAIEEVETRERAHGRTVKTVFDVGASIGEAALPMAKAFKDAKVYCFEPFADSFKTLTKRTKKIADRTSYFNYGLYNKEGEMTFHVWDGHSDGSSIIEPPSTQKHHPITIRTRTLDDVCAELGITHIDFMKVDVEGVEKEMLEGAREILKHTDNVFVEISPTRKGFNHDYIDVFEYMYQAGLSFVGVYSDYLFTRLT